MTHYAIHEQLGGKTVDWMEKVSDEQYRAARAEPGESGGGGSGPRQSLGAAASVGRSRRPKPR